MSKLKPVFCYIIITVVTFLVYYNSLSNEFVFDDESVVIGNASIQNISNIPKFFSADEGFHKVIGRYYRPVVSTSYAIDYSVWGLDPYGYHLTNVIIHIIACLLLFKILSVLFWRYKYRNLFSLFAALIFAVHPIHTEAVSWVSGRTDSLVTLFFFASFLCYLQFTKEQEFVKSEKAFRKIETKNYFYFALSIFFYAIGLLTKEMIITMPLIIILYDFVYRKKNLNYFKENWITYASFVLVTLVYIWVRYELLKDVPERENYLYFKGKSYDIVAGTMLKTIPVYFRLLFAPIPLLYHYNGVIPDVKSFMDSTVALSLAFTCFLIIVSIYFYKKDSIISFCILFFLISLLPVMNIIPTMNLMAERFLYFSSFALALLICHLAMLGSSKRDFPFLLIGMLVIVSLLSYLTYKRNIDWKDNNTLYSSTKGVEGTVLLVNEGNIYANNKKYDEASQYYKRAIELRYNSVLAHHNLGLIYLLRGKLDSAAMKFKTGISIDSLAPDGYFQLATVYNMENKPDSAILMLEKLQEISPGYRDSESILENLKAGGGRDPNLIPHSFAEDEAKKSKISMLEKKSYENFTEKKYQDAVKDLEQLIKLSKDSVSISGFMNNIAMCYEQMEMPEMEEKYFLQAIKTNGSNVNAFQGIAGFYLRQGNAEKAKEYFNRVLKLKPDDQYAKIKLDSLNGIKN